MFDNVLGIATDAPKQRVSLSNTFNPGHPFDSGGREVFAAYTPERNAARRIQEVITYLPSE